MKNIFSTIIVWLITTLAWAAIPKAEISVTPLQNEQWPARYQVTLIVPKDHHAYLDTGQQNAYIPIKIVAHQSSAKSGIEASIFKKPAGVNDSVYKATVLRDKGDFQIELKQTSNNPSLKTAELNVTYQLCNEQTNVCFRPQTTTLKVDLPTLPPANNPGNSAADSSTSLMDKLLQLFKTNQNNTLILFSLMFMAGLLSVATPCVYPMLPITSMFIIGRANGEIRKEKQHALAYLIGMIITYMVLGLIAGMTGGAFNTVMQSAAVNIGFAVFFAFFAISLLGFYELSFMQNEVYSLDQQSAKVKGVSGTLMMGCVAGLVISPCVGPIVFALLLQIADNIAAKADALAALNQTLGFWDKLAIASQGSLMMGGFGLGIAIPFFVISVVKFKKLPKAGYWMNKIKYAFGLMILYFAYSYLAKGLGILGADPATILSLAIGIAAVWLAVVHCNAISLMPHDALPNQKVQHFAGILSLLVGGWLVVSVLGKLPFMNPAQPLSFAQTALGSPSQAMPITPVQTTTQEEAGITWYRNFAVAQKAAKTSGKPIFVDFYANWCANCVEFKKETANNSQLNQSLREKAIAVKLIDQEPDFEKFRASNEHRPLKIGLPYFAIITPDGKVAWSGTDYKATETIVNQLDRLSSCLINQPVSC